MNKMPDTTDCTLMKHWELISMLLGYGGVNISGCGKKNQQVPSDLCVCNFQNGCTGELSVSRQNGRVSVCVCVWVCVCVCVCMCCACMYMQHPLGRGYIGSVVV